MNRSQLRAAAELMLILAGIGAIAVIVANGSAAARERVARLTRRLT